MNDDSRERVGTAAEPTATATNLRVGEGRARSRRTSSPKELKELVAACAAVVAHNAGMNVPPSLLAFSLARLGAALGEVVDEYTYTEEP